MEEKSCASVGRGTGLAVIGVVAAITIATDQISKRLIMTYLSPGEVVPVVPGFFNLTLTFNPGAAFGLWSNLPSGWREFALGLSIALALGVVVFFLRHPAYQSFPARMSLSAVLGGAIGNVVDRFVYGSVVDFLDVYIRQWHWPAFNVADSAISLGVGALLFSSITHPSATCLDTHTPSPSEGARPPG